MKMFDLIPQDKPVKTPIMGMAEAIALRPPKGFRVIMADPAWRYDNWSKAGTHKNASTHYDCMTIDDIQNMKVEALAAENSILFLWVTDPLLPEGIETIRKWGFKYSTVGFTWHKKKVSGAEHLGLGYITRGNPEMCLIGTKGSIGRPDDKSIRQFQSHCVREHSRKPDEIRTEIEKLYTGPRIELFAREKKKGWIYWGNQTTKFNGEENET